MAQPNPYAPPEAVESPAGSSVHVAAYGESYVPLGWRTPVAATLVCASVVVGVVGEFVQLSIGEALQQRVRAGDPDLVDAMVIGLAGLASLVVTIGAWVFAGMWLHRAARNLRGLGRFGMQFSPAACVGWYFVPVANFWKPVQAMSEIWRASDPAADQGSWLTGSRGTPLLAVWWSAWLLSSLVALGTFATMGQPTAAATVGLTSKGFLAVAAVAFVLLMRGVASRQEQAGARLPPA